MTYQPPPPPPQGPPPQGPPGGPPGQWGPPGGPPARRGGSFDPKSVNPLDWGILGAGALAFIFSFVSYYTFSSGGYSVDESAWHGFFGWFAMLLAVIGSAAVALELFMPHVRLPLPNRLIALAAYALAVICVLLALLVVPDYLGYGVEEGHGVGYWISLIVIIAGAVLTFMRFQQTGGQLPIGGGRGGNAGVGGASGQGGAESGGYGPPAGGGYGPPASGGYGPPASGGYGPPAGGGYGPPQGPPAGGGYGPPAGGGYGPPQGQQGPPPPPPSH